MDQHHRQMPDGSTYRDDADLIEHLYGARPPGSPPMSRDDHLRWAKERALEYLDDDPTMAFTSLVSDLSKHPNLIGHAGIELGTMMLMSLAKQGKPKSDVVREMRLIIEGCN